jgi:hypothetical protein
MTITSPDTLTSLTFIMAHIDLKYPQLENILKFFKVCHTILQICEPCVAMNADFQNDLPNFLSS